MQQDADFISADFLYMFRASCAHHQEYKLLTRQPPFCPCLECNVIVTVVSNVLLADMLLLGACVVVCCACETAQ